MSPAPCPEREQLERVLLGLLPETQADQIEQHVLECQRCVATMVELKGSDTLVEAMRAGPGASAEMAEYRDQVKVVVDRWASPRGAPVDATPSGSAADDPTSELGPRRTFVSDDQDEATDFLAPPQAADELGRLGNYRVLRILGTGGMGVVFEAEDMQLKRRVALKAMKPSVAASASARRRFLREAQTAASVEHDHIVPIYQVGDDRGIPFIAMPLLRGETLAERLEKSSVRNALRGVPPVPGQHEGETRRQGDKENIDAPSPLVPLSLGPLVSPSTSGALPVSELIRIGREIALGLDAAHRAGLIHRDIKPGNIWLEAETGRVKILDFGLARAASTDEQLTQAGMLLGTPSYMSPEQGRGEEIDARADLFSLGCVLYHMATGARPFVGRDPFATLFAVMTHQPRSPRELNPDLPNELNDLIVSLLSKDRAGRPQTAREVADRLPAVGWALPTVRENERQKEEGTQGADDTLAVSPSLLPSVAPSPLAAPPSAPRRRGLTMVAAAAAAAALLMGVVIVIKNRENKVVAVVKTKDRADAKVAPEFTVEVSAEATEDLRADSNQASGTAGDASPASYRWPADAPAPAIVPFDAAEAKKHQQQWADYLKLPPEHTNSIGIKFVLIPPGEFTMGSTAEVIDEAMKVVNRIIPDNKLWHEFVPSEAPRHKVVITRPFYLSAYEVTQKEYETVIGVNPSGFTKTSADNTSSNVGDDTTKHPVENVRWNDAAEFCAKLSQREHLEPFYVRSGETVTGLTGPGYRLPTEAEWEFACRAGTTTKSWVGDRDEDLLGVAWLFENAGGRTHPVGRLPGNPFGLFDLFGNVAEWAEDSWQPEFYQQFTNKLAIDPKCTLSGPKRAFRGGAWYEPAIFWRSATRNGDDPVRRGDVGIRLVLVPEALHREAMAASSPSQAPKTQDLSPKTSLANPKSKIENPKSLPPLSAMSLVTEPTEIADVKSWTLETIGHRGGIYEAEYSPDGKRLATLGDDGTLRLWDPATGKLIRIIVARVQARGALAWSADSAQLAIADTDAIRIWKVGAGKLAKTLSIERANYIYKAALSPDGKTMAIGLARDTNGQHQHRLELIDVESGELLESRSASWDEHHDVRWHPQTLCWSPDGERLAFNSTIWHVESGRTQATAGKVGTSFAWRADGALLTAVLATVGGDCKVELWRADTGELLSTLPGFSFNNCGVLPPPVFSPRGDVLLAVPVGSLDQPAQAFLWSTSSYETIKTVSLSAFTDTSDFRVAPEGASLASFGCDAGDLRVINAADETSSVAHKLALMNPRTQFVAAWSFNGATLAARSEEDQVSLWDLKSGGRRALSRTTKWWIDGLIWRDGEPLLDAWMRGGDAIDKLAIDGATGQVLRSIQALVPSGEFTFLSTRARRYVVAASGRVKIFAADPLKLLRELDAECKFSPALSPDGLRLATIADKTTIWDVDSGRQIASFDVAAPAEWSPDGGRLVYTIGSGQRFEIRDAESGERLVELRLDGARPAEKQATIAAGARLAWSPDGSHIAGFGRVWDARSGEVVCDLNRFGGQANTGQPVWSPDGAYLAYGAPDRAMTVADATTGHVLATLFSFTRGRTLSVSPHGHFHASPRLEGELVYVVETDAGQETLTPQEFMEKYGWKNDPSRVGLDGGREQVSVGNALHGVPDEERGRAGGGEIAKRKVAVVAEESGNELPHSKALSPLALVQQPAALPGVESWSLESSTPEIVNDHPMQWALHPDGLLLAVGGQDGHVRVYEAFADKEPRLAKLLMGHSSPIAVLEWSPDGKWLASAEQGRPSVRVWDATTGQSVSEGLAPLNWINYLRWSPDGLSIAVGGYGGANLLDPTSGEIIVMFDARGDVNWLSWSPDAKRVAGAVGTATQIWDATSGESLQSLAKPAATGFRGSVAWSPDGESVAYSSVPGVYIWDPTNGALKSSFTVGDLPRDHIPPIAWSDKTSKLCIGTAHGSEIWDVATGTKVADEPLLGWSGVRSDNGRTISDLSPLGLGITVYDTTSRKRRTLPLRSTTTAAAWSPDGHTLATGTQSKVYVWSNGKPPRLEALTPTTGNWTCRLSWLGNSGSLLDAHAGTDTVIFSPNTQGWQSKLLGFAPTVWQGALAVVAVSADGQRLAGVPPNTDGKTVVVWDLAIGKRLNNLAEHNAEVTTVAWSPNGERLACFSTTGEVTVWNALIGSRLHQARLWPPDHSSNWSLLSWSPDGRLLAVCSHDGVVRLCDDELRVRCDIACNEYGYGVTAMQWDKDGETLQTAGAKAICRWEASSGKLLAITPHGLPNQAVVPREWQFSSDGKRLVTTGSAARVWNAETGELQASLVQLPDERAAVVSAEGHYLTSSRLADNNLLYVVQATDGQELLSPPEFAAKYGWQNDPGRVSLVK